MAHRTAVRLLLLLPVVTARLNTGIRELTETSFDGFVGANQKVMIDFVLGGDNQTKNLTAAVRMLRDAGNRVPFGRVDIDKHPTLAKRFFEGCNEEKHQCAVQFPQLLWFVNGHASQYHRSLSQPEHVASFVLAMDRDLVAKVSSIAEVPPWNRYVLFRGERSSELYRTLEHVAARHMDTLAVAHFEEAGASNLSWIVNESVVDTFGDSADEDSVETWVRHHLIFSEDKPDQELQEDGSVVVVASTFEEKVLRNDTDVFFLVYAPWCGFSRKLLPVWTKFAKSVNQSRIAGLTIAKMDGVENSVETQEYKWKTFPTLVYFRAGNQTPLYYEPEAERTVEAFFSFARQHGSSKVDFADETEDSIVLLQSGRPRGRPRGALYRESMEDILI